MVQRLESGEIYKAKGAKEVALLGELSGPRLRSLSAAILPLSRSAPIPDDPRLCTNFLPSSLVIFDYSIFFPIVSGFYLG